MSAFNQFLSATSLKRIPAEFLREILTPIQPRLEAIGLWVDDDKKGFDCNNLAKWIRNNSLDIDQNIFDAFFYINSLIKGKMHDRIFGELSAMGHGTLGDEGFLAAKLWCLNSELAKRLHSEVRVKAQHSFTFYKLNLPLFESLAPVSDETIDHLERQFKVWFEINNKGKTAQVFQHDIKGKLYYHIQHGTTLKREPVIENNESTIAIFRLEVEDILVFDKKTGELGIYLSEPSVRLENQYKKVFGFTFLEDENCYVFKHKFALNAVLAENFAINYGHMRDKITFLEIKEICIGTSHYVKNDITFGSGNDALVFMRRMNLEHNGFVKSIKFRIMFAGEDKEKTFSISSDKRAVYPPFCDHALIEEILELNGICLNSEKTKPTKVDADKNLQLVGV